MDAPDRIVLATLLQASEWKAEAADVVRAIEAAFVLPGWSGMEDRRAFYEHIAGCGPCLARLLRDLRAGATLQRAFERVGIEPAEPISSPQLERMDAVKGVH